MVTKTEKWGEGMDKFSSVQFSHSVMSDSLWPHELQHARPPCPSPTPGVHPNPCPLSRWSHPTISSSIIPFSSYPQSFPASGSFQTSQLFASGGQSTGVSATTSVIPMNTQDWSPLGWTYPITSWYIDGERVETVETVTLFCGAPKLLQMVTAAMKLKDAYSLEEKLWPT